MKITNFCMLIKFINVITLDGSESYEKIWFETTKLVHIWFTKWFTKWFTFTFQKIWFKRVILMNRLASALLITSNYMH